MKYRSRTEIIADILRAALDGGVTKTGLMRTAVVPYSRLKEYLTTLLEYGYLEWDGTSNTFRTTERGGRFLSNIREFTDITMKGRTEAS